MPLLWMDHKDQKVRVQFERHVDVTGVGLTRVGPEQFIALADGFASLHAHLRV